MNPSGEDQTATNVRIEDVDTPAPVEALERTGEHDAQAAESLRADLALLREEAARTEIAFREQLAEATIRRNRAEAKLAEQTARLDALGKGREETMLELQRTRAELARVNAEKDRLWRELAALTRMQTETLAFTEHERDRFAPERLPTLEALMSNWSAIQEAPAELRSEVEAEIEADDGPGSELIPPDAVFAPEDFRDDMRTAAPAPKPASASASGSPAQRTSSVLVFLDADPPIKYPLYKDVTMIGRSELADVRVDGDFISRVHARILRAEGEMIVEDAGSKNGIEVNGRSVFRHTLQHGDVLSLRTLHFTYIDTTAHRRDR